MLQGAAFVTTVEKDKEKDKRDMSDSPKPIVERDWTNAKCFKCKKKGHPVKSCPEKEAEHKAVEGSVHLMWGNANVMTTFNVRNATDEMLEVLHDEVLLDTQANISLFHPSVLQEVQESNKTIRVNGIGGYQMTVSKKRYLPGFFDISPYGLRDRATSVALRVCTFEARKLILLSVRSEF